ncbi:MAG: DNA repair protein RecO [Candidatus Thiodiazotropha endolucinida]|nr:DNA repair protein RecO [Candidatus Thiodiazotropha taylori]MCG8092542.1 DNA repair protein RecO [Candidatus Thiodiazotropha endolucinida]MCG8060853.1 DNA repair protein RecO [Candidatus Thiodiazotropha taylori]MCG8064048.1 DNA repair protein RecO [Candidatus Thiodiazotropha taylori]MCW4330133.1 DNA repair protein RecO [Candidatus Thiodiazotropha endolucinida]
MNELSPAFVIHRRDYRNTSLLLELFLANQGRIPAIARGAKSGHSSRALLLQPFSPLGVTLTGRGEVKNLKQVEPDGHPYRLKQEMIYCGIYLNELLMRLLQRGDPYPSLYVHYQQTLARLAFGESANQCLRDFEVSLVRELGYGLLLDRTADTNEPILQGQIYEYHIEHGPVVATGSGTGIGIHGQTLISLHRGERLDERGRVEAKQLMRRVISYYLGNKPLKSRELFQSLK